MMHFVRTFSIMRANWGVRLIVIEKVRYYEKIIYSLKTCLEMAGGGEE